jgi:hypothetical protein
VVSGLLNDPGVPWVRRGRGEGDSCLTFTIRPLSWFMECVVLLMFGSSATQACGRSSSCRPAIANAASISDNARGIGGGPIPMPSPDMVEVRSIIICPYNGGIGGMVLPPSGADGIPPSGCGGGLVIAGLL